MSKGSSSQMNIGKAAGVVKTHEKAAAVMKILEKVAAVGESLSTRSRS